MFSISCLNPKKPNIEIWYGNEQYFGSPGNTQPYINILGNIRASTGIAKAYYSINEGSDETITLGSDLHRLAATGDFNIEFNRDLLTPGLNSVCITAIDSSDRKSEATVKIHYKNNETWPLPFNLNWDTVKNIQDVAHVINGKWELTDLGVRVKDPYFDRIIALGDRNWKNYEVSVEVIFHNYEKPIKGRGAPYFNVTHAAIASRWIGYTPDNNNPYRGWYPLGASCEFRLTRNLDSCSYRILGGGRTGNYHPNEFHSIKMNTKYIMKTSTKTIGNDSALFRAKLWESGIDEPEKWDVSYIKSPEEVESGCILLIAHHTDVTFGSIKVNPIRSNGSESSNY